MTVGKDQRIERNKIKDVSISTARKGGFDVFIYLCYCFGVQNNDDDDLSGRLIGRLAWLVVIVSFIFLGDVLAQTTDKKHIPVLQQGYQWVSGQIVRTPTVHQVTVSDTVDQTVPSQQSTTIAALR